MSSNNFVRISKFKDQFIVKELDADTGETNFLIGKYFTLPLAIVSANEYMAKEPVEYGLEISSNCV